MKAVGNRLVIYLNGNIVVFVTDPDATFMQTSEVPEDMALYLGHGAIAPDGVLSFGKDSVFWSKFGVKSLASSLQTGRLEIGEDVSEPIDNHLEEKFDFVRTNNLEDYISMEHYPKRSWIILNYPVNAGATTFEQAVYHYQYGAWFEWKGINVFSMLSDSQGRLFGGGAGFIYRLDNGTNDDGAAIDTVWTTPWLYLGEGSVNKFLRYLTYIFSGTTTIEFDQTLAFDFSASAADIFTETFTVTPTGSQWDIALWDIDLWDGANRIKLRRAVRGKGLAFKLSLRNNKADQAFVLEYMRIEHLLGGAN